MTPSNDEACCESLVSPDPRSHDFGTSPNAVEASFHLLAFELLGIDGLPLPRINWHLKEGQDGYDDPYLSDHDYQRLCNIVCERMPGMTVQAWRESTRGERIALMETALKRGPAELMPSEATLTPAWADTLTSTYSGSRVVLRGPGEPPTICGKEKAPLTLAQYDVVKALLSAGERGLSKDELDHKSKHGDARKILKRLADSDPDWKAVIRFPGIAGRRYRIV
jgi:hypothetical protein